MIHLHSLFSSETNTSVIGPNGGAPLSPARLESFHGALSDAVSSTLEKFGIHPNDVKISITPANAAATPAAGSNGSGKAVRTAPPTPGTSTSTPSASSGASSSQAPNGGYDPFLQAAYNNPYQAASGQTSAQSTSASTESTAAPVDAQQAFDDAYWASQPPAVQALQTIQNPEQRTALATQLASEGYSIDVPIMVWGWDPSITMAMRQADGYTWVPSALQNPVEDAPGLATMGTYAAYSANNPPAGSIAVS